MTKSTGAHTCHAIGCSIRCRPEYLLCPRHWRMVPRREQLNVWRHYREGQCDDKRPSRAWVEAAKAAIRAVAVKEGRPEVEIKWGEKEWDEFAEVVNG